VFVFGPIVLVALPSRGFHGSVLAVILLGATIATIPTYWMWKELREETCEGTRIYAIAALLGLTVLCMASGRHMFRGIMLADHRRAMAAETERFTEASAQAAYDLELGVGRAARGESPGETVFHANCAACHGVDKKVVGPPLTEIATIYAKDPGGIVRWARAPGKKRAGAPQMPPFASLGDEKLGAVAAYMLEAGAKAQK